MPRRLGVLAVVAVLLVPDWAAAFGWQSHCYAPPAYYSQPAIILVPVCPPAVYTPLPPPTVHVSPPAAPPQEMPRKNTQAPTEPEIKPAEFATPKPAPPSDGGGEPRRSPAPPARPAEEEAANKVPKLDLPLPAAPSAPVAPPAEPKLELPPIKPAAKAETPKLAMPKTEPAKTEPAKTELTIPPIVLPQLPPPGGVSESKYRPATTDRPSVAVLPVDGTPPAGAKRKVGFYNYTGLDLELKVEGTAVTLPAKSYVTADVPTKFTWRVGTAADETTTIPADSAGVEVVLK
jgi:hypothetical protein